MDALKKESDPQIQVRNYDIFFLHIVFDKKYLEWFLIHMINYRSGKTIFIHYIFILRTILRMLSQVLFGNVHNAQLLLIQIIK